jgi:hypothetical protein
MPPLSRQKNSLDVLQELVFFQGAPCRMEHFEDRTGAGFQIFLVFPKRIVGGRGVKLAVGDRPCARHCSLLCFDRFYVRSSFSMSACAAACLRLRRCARPFLSYPLSRRGGLFNFLFCAAALSLSVHWLITATRNRDRFRSPSALSSTRLGRYGRYYIDQFSPYFVPFTRGQQRGLRSILSRVFGAIKILHIADRNQD